MDGKVIDNMLDELCMVDPEYLSDIEVLADKIEKAITVTHCCKSDNELLCDNPNCEDGIVDYDYYKNPIYCQVCDKHN